MIKNTTKRLLAQRIQDAKRDKLSQRKEYEAKLKLILFFKKALLTGSHQKCRYECPWMIVFQLGGQHTTEGLLNISSDM